jgi:hypothetical protein
MNWLCQNEFRNQFWRPELVWLPAEILICFQKCFQNLNGYQLGGGCREMLRIVEACGCLLRDDSYKYVHIMFTVELLSDWTQETWTTIQFKIIHLPCPCIRIKIPPIFLGDSFSHSKGIKFTTDVWQEGAVDNICTYERQSYGKEGKNYTQRGCLMYTLRLTFLTKQHEIRRSRKSRLRQ